VEDLRPTGRSLPITQVAVNRKNALVPQLYCLEIR
jgi:hypothetical protein